jgi:hypothetical protein
MYSKDEYENLTSKYGSYSSWAIWDETRLSNYSIICNNIDKLHSNYVLLALNISGPLLDGPWANFHVGPSNVRKLMYASRGTALWGSYMTDIFKGIVEQKSSQLKYLLTDKIIAENVEKFTQEMGDIKISPDSTFIIFGTPTSYLSRCFNKYFRQRFNHRIIYHYHYSYWGLSDKKWVENLWTKTRSEFYKTAII